MAAQPRPVRSSDYVSRPRPITDVLSSTKHLEKLRRERQVINATANVSAIVSLCFAIGQLITQYTLTLAVPINFAASLIFALIPYLHRFGRLVSPLALIFTAYLTAVANCWDIGTDSGLQFYIVVSAAVAVMVLATDHIRVVVALCAVGLVLVITMQFLVVDETGRHLDWATEVVFVANTIVCFSVLLGVISYAVREINRAEAALAREHARSESLLANILPSSVAARLKDPRTTIIADRYNDASIMFADMAGYTERASELDPAALVEFLNVIYSEFDHLVKSHGLEKIKTTGDCYIVVSGIPDPRPDHLEALACLSLDMVDAVEGLADPRGRGVPLRIGIAAGAMVAGVVGTRRFFYDVWGDTVNIASRMESTGVEGRIQVTDAVGQRLKDRFLLEERGEVTVKGKGVMRTWFLVGQQRQDVGNVDAAPAHDGVAMASEAGGADVT